MDTGAESYRRYLDGDDSAVAEIVGAYKDGLILFINSLVGNLYTAEELTEDTFFRLIAKKPRFSGKSSFKSWLYAIGRHTAIDHIRRHAHLSDTPIEDMEEYLCDGQSLEEAYIKEEGKTFVHRALSALSPDYRQILWLTYFEGFPNREAAVILGKNERQIRNLLYRAKQALKSELDREGFTYENT